MVPTVLNPMVSSSAHLSSVYSLVVVTGSKDQLKPVSSCDDDITVPSAPDSDSRSS